MKFEMPVQNDAMTQENPTIDPKCGRRRNHLVEGVVTPRHTVGPDVHIQDSLGRCEFATPVSRLRGGATADAAGPPPSIDPLKNGTSRPAYGP